MVVETSIDMGVICPGEMSNFTSDILGPRNKTFLLLLLVLVVCAIEFLILQQNSVYTD